MAAVAGATPASRLRLPPRRPCVFLSLPGPDDVETAIVGAEGCSPPTRAGVRRRPVDELAAARPAPARALRSGRRRLRRRPGVGRQGEGRLGRAERDGGRDDADVAAVEPLLQAFAAQVFHVGPAGAGTIAKLVNNQLFLAAGVLVQEAYVLGAAAGLDPAALHRIVRASSGGPYAALAPLLLGRDFDDVIFRLDIATKDLALAVETAGEHGVEVPTTAAALAVVPRRDRRGPRAKAFHATLEHVERTAGITLPALTRGPRPS